MLRTLVVDDWPDPIATLHLLLHSWGYEACVASDGPTALKLANRFQPDVVILDIALPGMDGYEVAKRWRRQHSQKPLIIAHSGYCTDADVRLSLEAGCHYHFAKPVDPDVIKRLLEAYAQWLLKQSPS